MGSYCGALNAHLSVPLWAHLSVPLDAHLSVPLDAHFMAHISLKGDG